MIFLIDAQLPRRLARVLQQYGHQAYHTLDLPQQNRTDDDEIMQFADTHDCMKDGQYELIYTVSSATYSGRYWMISTNEMEIDIERSPVNKHGPPYRQFFDVASDVLTITRIVKLDNGNMVTNSDTYRKVVQ